MYIKYEKYKVPKLKYFTNYNLTLSASMRAPASMTNSNDSSSLTTAAVRPAAVLALPDVYTARGQNSSTVLKYVNHFEFYSLSSSIHLLSTTTVV